MIDATVNVNGQISDARSAVVSVFDHGFLFGDGVYETLRTYNHRPFLLDRHLTRLRASAGAIGLPVPLSDDELGDRINETMDAAGIPDERYVRVLHTRGVGDLSYNPTACPEPTTIIIVRPHLENPPDVLARGIAIIVSSVLRNHPQAIDPRIKSNNLLNNALAMQEAIRVGADEALMRNHRGEVSECAQSNFFLVRHSEAVTPSLETGVLEGVTRNFVFEVGARIDVPVRAAVLQDADLVEADEMFITSTTREILPVTSIDGRPVASGEPGSVSKALAQEFRRRADELSR